MTPGTTSGHLRGNLFFLHSWLHSCTKLSHRCRLAQASGGSPDSSTGCWCQGVCLTTAGETMSAERARLCCRTEKCEHFSLLLPLLVLSALDMWENYKTHLLCNTFVPSPTRSAATESVRDVSSSNVDLASSLLPWMKRAVITLAVDEEDEGLELARN